MEKKEYHYLPEDKYLDIYDNCTLKIATRRVIRYLSTTSKPKTLIDIISDTKISAIAFAHIYSELFSLGNLIEETSKHTFFLTREGRIWAIKNRKELYMSKEELIYKKNHNLIKNYTKNIVDRKTLPQKYALSKIDLMLLGS